MNMQAAFFSCVCVQEESHVMSFFGNINNNKEEEKKYFFLFLFFLKFLFAVYQIADDDGNLIVFYLQHCPPSVACLFGG